MQHVVHGVEHPALFTIGFMHPSLRFADFIDDQVVLELYQMCETVRQEPYKYVVSLL